jgi:hypothetical protein
VSARPSAQERLQSPDAFLTRGDLAELGLERRAVDAAFRGCPTIHMPGYSRPLLLVREFVAWREACTHRGDRAR